VIEIKLREIDVLQRYETRILSCVVIGKPIRTLTNLDYCSAAFKKWKTVRVRHTEELSLMESYQFVKREGTGGLRCWPRSLAPHMIVREYSSHIPSLALCC
jgi:hypothetical protein